MSTIREVVPVQSGVSHTSSAAGASRSLLSIEKTKKSAKLSPDDPGHAASSRNRRPGPPRNRQKSHHLSLWASRQSRDLCTILHKDGPTLATAPQKPVRPTEKSKNRPSCHPSEPAPGLRMTSLSQSYPNKHKKCKKSAKLSPPTTRPIRLRLAIVLNPIRKSAKIATTVTNSPPAKPRPVHNPAQRRTAAPPTRNKNKNSVNLSPGGLLQSTNCHIALHP
jgi:hypothetical protein